MDRRFNKKTGIPINKETPSSFKWQETKTTYERWCCYDTHTNHCQGVYRVLYSGS